MANSQLKHELDFSLVLASSVHDMKNSIGMLLNSLEEIIKQSETEASPEQRGRFSVLQYEASRINSELIQLLSVYRMQKNRLFVHIDQHYVIEVFEDQLARNHTLFDIRNVSVEVDCDPDLDWYFDLELVGGVIHNVLINCVRYTKSALLLSAKFENDVLCIEVSDDGSGYPEAMLTSTGTSEDFSRYDQHSTHLGLFFAQQVAQLHSQHGESGRIQISNNGPLGGGTFKLFIP